jgi:hypothetical protein
VTARRARRSALPPVRPPEAARPGRTDGPSVVRPALLRATCLVAAAVTMLGLAGCGAVWTYDGVMELNRRQYGSHFEPPDSVAYALPPLPPVYAVVFQESYYMPPPKPMVLSRPIQPGIPADSVKVEIAFADTTGADTVFVGPILDLGPPPLVRVDLTPAQEEALRSRAARDIARANRLLEDFPASGAVPRDNRERVEAARGLLLQAGTALEREDYLGAANLAEKARLLAENLAAGRP